ncbi:hypothetical protein CEXT_552261 [Caerostris extrusa]|uniref:Uncharacterized protein n=1 Tax=Caerostris extrusa TaxID=172846 RepID=A0AAV4STN0_CAEEX|nr:hypothetical protein CEXT_552261 [Caerostris extrusa]
MKEDAKNRSVSIETPTPEKAARWKFNSMDVNNNSVSPGQARVEEPEEGVAPLLARQQAEEASEEVLEEPATLLRRERRPQDLRRRVARMHQHTQGFQRSHSQSEKRQESFQHHLKKRLK